MNNPRYSVRAWRSWSDVNHGRTVDEAFADRWPALARARLLAQDYPLVEVADRERHCIIASQDTAPHPHLPRDPQPFEVFA